MIRERTVVRRGVARREVTVDWLGIGSVLVLPFAALGFGLVCAVMVLIGAAGSVARRWR